MIITNLWIVAMCSYVFAFNSCTRFSPVMRWRSLRGWYASTESTCPSVTSAQDWKRYLATTEDLCCLVGHTTAIGLSRIVLGGSCPPHTLASKHTHTRMHANTHMHRHTLTHTHTRARAPTHGCMQISTACKKNKREHFQVKTSFVLFSKGSDSCHSSDGCD